MRASLPVPHNIPVGKRLFLTLGFLVCAGWGQNRIVLDPKLLADERIWSLLVDEKVGFCVGDSVFHEKLDKVAGDRVFLKVGAFAYMPRGSLALSEIDSVLVRLPLHEGGACLLVPVVCVGGGILSAIPISILLWEYINRPEYPDYERANEINRWITYGLTSGLTAAGIYYSYRYLREAGRSDYKTQLFLRRLEEAR